MSYIALLTQLMNVKSQFRKCHELYCSTDPIDERQVSVQEMSWVILLYWPNWWTSSLSGQYDDLMVVVPFILTERKKKKAKKAQLQQEIEDIEGTAVICVWRQ